MYHEKKVFVLLVVLNSELINQPFPFQKCKNTYFLYRTIEKDYCG